MITFIVPDPFNFYKKTHFLHIFATLEIKIPVFD